MYRLAALNAPIEGESEEPVANVEQQETKVYNLYLDAVRLHHLQRVNEAEAKYQRIIEMFNEVFKDSSMRELPTFKRLRYLALKNLGDIQMKAHRYAEALVNFAQALDIDAEEIIVWRKLGEVALHLNNLSVARYAFATTVAKQPNHWLSISKLADVLYLLGDFEGAKQVIQTIAFRLDPHWPRGHELLAQMAAESQTMHHRQDGASDTNSRPATRPRRDSLGSLDVDSLAEQRRKRQKKFELPPVEGITLHLKHGTWQHLAEVLHSTCKQYLQASACATPEASAVSITSPITFIMDESIDALIQQNTAAGPQVPLAPVSGEAQTSAASKPPVVDLTVPSPPPHPTASITDAMLIDLPPLEQNSSETLDEMLVDAFDMVPPPPPPATSTTTEAPAATQTDTAPNTTTMSDQELQQQQQTGENVGLSGDEMAVENAPTEATPANTEGDPDNKNEPVKPVTRRSARKRDSLTASGRKALEDVPARLAALSAQKQLEQFLQALLTYYNTRNLDDFELPGIYEHAESKPRTRRRRQTITLPSIGFTPSREAASVKSFVESVNGAPFYLVLKQFVIALATTHWNDITWTAAIADAFTQFVDLSEALGLQGVSTNFAVKLCASELGVQAALALGAESKRQEALSKCQEEVQKLFIVNWSQEPIDLKLRASWLWANLLEQLGHFDVACTEYSNCQKLFSTRESNIPIVVCGINGLLGEISAEVLEGKVKGLAFHAKFKMAKELYNAKKHTELVQMLEYLLNETRTLPEINDDIPASNETSGNTASEQQIASLKWQQHTQLLTMLLGSYIRLRQEKQETTNELLAKEFTCCTHLLQLAQLDVGLASVEVLDEINTSLAECAKHPSCITPDKQWALLKLAFITMRNLRNKLGQSHSPRLAQVMVLIFHCLTLDPTADARVLFRLLHYCHEELASHQRCNSQFGLLLKTTIKFLETTNPEQVDEVSSDESSEEEEPQSPTTNPERDSSAMAVEPRPRPSSSALPSIFSSFKLETTHAVTLRRCYSCLYEVILPDPDVPQSEIEPHPQIKSKHSKKGEKLEDMYRFFTFLKPLAYALIESRSKSDKLLKSYHESLRDIDRAFRSVYPLTEISKVHSIVEDYLAGKTSELARLNLPDTPYKDVVDHIYYLRGKIKLLKDKKLGAKSKDNKPEDPVESENKAQTKYMIQLAINPKHSQSWIELGSTYLHKFIALASEALDGIWRGEPQPSQIVAVESMATQAERCLTHFLSALPSESQPEFVTAMFDLGRLHFLRAKFIAFTKHGLFNADYSPVLKSLMNAASCFKTVCGLKRKWHHDFMLARTIETVLRVLKRKTGVLPLEWSTTESATVPSGTQVDKYNWKDCLALFGRATTEALAHDKRIAEPFYKLHSLRMTVAYRLLELHATKGKLTEDQILLLGDLEQHRFSAKTDSRKRLTDSQSVPSPAVNEASTPEESSVAQLQDVRSRLINVLRNTVDALSYCDKSISRYNTGKPEYRLAKFFMSKGDFLPIEFRNPTRAFEELKVIFQLAAKRGPSSNLWNFWRQGDTDQFEVPNKLSHDNRRYLRLFVTLLHALKDIETFEVVIYKIPQTLFSDIFPRYFRLYIELQMELITSLASSDDTAGKDKAIVRAFATKRDFVNTRTAIERAPIDQLVASAYWALVKQRPLPVPGDKVQSIVEEATEWANSTRSELIAVKKVTKKPPGPAISAAATATAPSTPTTTTPSTPQDGPANPPSAAPPVVIDLERPELRDEFFVYTSGEQYKSR